MAEKKEKKSKAQERFEGDITDIVEAKKQLDIITQKFIDNPQPFFDERKKEVAGVIERYGDLQSIDLENGIMAKKDYALNMTERLMKPLMTLPVNPNATKHTALSLKLTSDFYWEEIVLPLNQKIDFIPSIYDYFSLLGISKATFDKYSQVGTEDMRETCEMILDKFVGYYQRKGMKKECDTIMAMFTLKTTFRQRENDAPQVVVANIQTSAQERISKYARQYGFDTWDGGEKNN